MGTFAANWEDEENNRIVELAVEYRLDGSEIVLNRVTPEAVTFVQAVTGEPIRSIRVWTETGRRVLHRAWKNSDGVEQVKTQLESQLAVA